MLEIVDGGGFVVVVVVIVRFLCFRGSPDVCEPHRKLKGFAQMSCDNVHFRKLRGVGRWRNQGEARELRKGKQTSIPTTRTSGTASRRKETLQAQGDVSRSNMGKVSDKFQEFKMLPLA